MKYIAKQSKNILILIALLALVMVSSACSNDKAEHDETTQKTAEELYIEARKLFDKAKYLEAVEAFDEVEQQHPHSVWALRAQIMAGYSYYKAEKYDEAIDTFERFVQLHPANESAAYAYYMIALSYYEQISDVGRDQGMTEKALLALKNVISRFPNSKYAADAKLKLDLTIDHLAGKEMMVGRYYLERDEYLSAINRFKYVLENYETTGHTPEALHRLVEAYLEMGIRAEAMRYAAVLGHNFPDSKWYIYSYNLLTKEK